MRKKLSPITHHLSPGFTLIELLVVIAIIGILAALIMTNFNAARERARDVQRKSDLSQIKSSLQMYYNDYDVYPLTGTDNKIKGCGTFAVPADCEWGEVFKKEDSDMVYMKILPHDPSYIGADDAPNYSYSCTDEIDYCLVATLENGSDRDIANSQARCSGCGTGTQYAVCSD